MVSTKFHDRNNNTNRFSRVDWSIDQGIQQHEAGELDRAIAFFLEGIELDAQQPLEIYIRLIELMAEANNLDEGKRIAKAASLIYPESAKLNQLSIELFSESDNSSGTLDIKDDGAFESRRQPPTTALSKCACPQVEVASKERTQLASHDAKRPPLKSDRNKLTRQEKINQLHAEGPKKYQADDLSGALECYLEAISLERDSPEWIYSSAITISAKLGRLEEALELGVKSLNLYPDSDEVHRSMGIAFELKEELESSVKHYYRSLELNPDQPKWLIAKLADHLESMSLKSHQLGNTHQAKQLFDRSTKVKQQRESVPQSKNATESPVIDRIDAEKRLKGAIVSWDLSHNPAGRSFLLADIAKVHFDVELIGPIFTFYGQEIWSPISDRDLEMSTFKTDSFENFVLGAIDLARAKKYDFVYVSKPRFPSLFIGMLIKHYSQCPMILDVDDHELSFFKNKPLATFEELIESARDTQWYKPYSEIWTRFAESLIPTADAITVSNVALQQRFGGIIVRHARDENIFDPRLYNRTNIRSQFGYQESDRVILFLGTPRPHKGIFDIAQALDSLDDPNLVLCVIGTINDKRVAKKFAEYKNARIDFHDNQPWSRLPELVSMADLICILQDPNSFIAEYQIPAKLTDALAMGVPTMVTKVPPLQDLIASKSVIAVEKENLATAIADFFNNKNAKILEHSRERYTYISEFTYGVNAARIEQALSKAKRNFKPFPEIYTKIFDLISIESGIEILEGKPSDTLQYTLPEQKISINQDEPFNVLFFWKQNDSDLYARRQDMIAKYLANSDRINKVIHFDAPISAGKLQEMVQYGPKAKFSQNNLVFTNTVDRFLGLKDTKKIIKRTFVYRDNNSGEKFLGRILPKKSDYPNFVRQVIKEAGVGRNTVAWVCPVNFEFPELHRELNFGCVIADIIDDQRQWDVKPQYLVRLSENYQQILKSADIAFTNCEPVKESFQELNSQIEVIPNGSELFPQTDNWSKPEFLAGLDGPIIGYVGNLSDRIDIELLKYIAERNPDWNIIAIGSAHGSAQIFELVKYANIHLLGVKPYDEAVKFIRYFDVAMIPHINNKLTKNMNCLKLYVYFAVGVPIVTTEIANIEEFAGNIYVARDREDFNRGIKEILAGKGLNPDLQKRLQLLDNIDWSNRVSKMLARIDKYFQNNSLPKDSNQFALTTVADYSWDGGSKPKVKDSNNSQPAQNPLTKSTIAEKTESSYSGVCNICGTQQIFAKNHNSLREGYQCCNCKASLRYRGQAEAIIRYYGRPNITLLKDLAGDRDFKNSSIYEPGVIGPFRKYFSHFSGYNNSYFWSDVTPGNYRNGVQCQNLENLTYNNDSFDLIVTSDMMEHIRHPHKAFEEIFRVLKPGKYHIFSIPVQVPMKQKTFYRVDTSTEQDIHLVEPKYHSAPKPGGGRSQSLVYTDFGRDIVQQLENIGYRVELLTPNVPDNCDGVRLITFVTQKV